MSKDIATLSNGHDTVGKFLRVMGNEGLSFEHFVLPVNDRKARRRLLKFYQDGCRFIMKCPNVFHVNRRSIPSVGAFLGEGWTEVHDDVRSLSLSEVDFSRAVFSDSLLPFEKMLTGQERMQREQAENLIRLDSGIGMSLYLEKGQRTLRFLYDALGVDWIEFSGSRLISPNLKREGCFCVIRKEGGGAEEAGTWGHEIAWLKRARIKEWFTVRLASNDE